MEGSSQFIHRIKVDCAGTRVVDVVAGARESSFLLLFFSLREIGSTIITEDGVEV